MTLFNLDLIASAILPHVNATLNATATVLLLTGLALIKLRLETAHKAVMGLAFATSIAFLTCYVWDKVSRATVGTPFPKEDYPGVATFYYVLLASHVLLAITVPFLAVITIYFGWKDRRDSHKRIARWTFPIWLYVSVTGVAIYVMLYWLFIPKDTV